MSLYCVQKLMYELNRNPALQKQFKADAETVLIDYTLTTDERAALLLPDIGLLYVMGVNGQILMHYAAFHDIAWPDYIQRMKDGVKKHGPVRTGLYGLSEDRLKKRTKQ